MSLFPSDSVRYQCMSPSTTLSMGWKARAVDEGVSIGSVSLVGFVNMSDMFYPLPPYMLF